MYLVYFTGRTKLHGACSTYNGAPRDSAFLSTPSLQLDYTHTLPVRYVINIHCVSYREERLHTPPSLCSLQGGASDFINHVFFVRPCHPRSALSNVIHAPLSVRYAIYILCVSYREGFLYIIESNEKHSLQSADARIFRAYGERIP